MLAFLILRIFIESIINAVINYIAEIRVYLLKILSVLTKLGMFNKIITVANKTPLRIFSTRDEHCLCINTVTVS